jgi:hypothetical protein
MQNKQIVLAALASFCAIAASAADTYSPPRTADGKPDLQGIWANNTATPLERPDMLKGRALLSDQEVAALKKRYAEIFAGDGDAAFGDEIFVSVLSEVQKYKPTVFDASTGNYNAFWLVAREFDNRTSLITDPADGKIPPIVSQRTDRTFPGMSAEGPESRGLSERCITFGVPDMLAGYNSYYQIVQTNDYVVFYSEKIHDARVIPLTTRPHSPKVVTSWMGDSRGHWEGDTLVVETTNLRSTFRGASEDLKLTERFRRAGPKTLNYQVTVNDPKTWARPWTFMIPLKHTDEHIYEYACHEGNTAMVGILAGARAEERKDRSGGK